MEQQSNNTYFTGIYQRAVKAGLFNYKLNNSYNLYNSYNFINQDNIISLDRVNIFFFGTNKFASNFNYLNLAKEDIIHKQDRIYYLKINKLESYLSHVISNLLIDTTFNTCPYNYYKFLEQSSIPPHYKIMIKTIDNFLNYLDNINTVESKTIRHLLTPNLKSLECELSDVLILTDNIYDNDFIIKLTKKGSPIFIRLTSNNLNTIIDDNTLILQETIDNDNFNSVFNYINKQLLLDNPTEFLINNIERVCGSRIFSEIMVNSYLNKNDYIFELNTISSVILWKNITIEQKYVQYFCLKYQDCINIINDNIYINFKGINKFLLNISEDDVENSDVKEQINDMYYNSMHELIFSFELLYKKNL